MEDKILNLSADDIVMRETQPTDSPATFSHKLIDHFGIRQHMYSSEAVDHNEQTQLCTILHMWLSM